MNQSDQHQQHGLAPCPFCGSHAQDDFIEGVSYIIECYACDASTGRQDSAEAAIAAWNRRADVTRAMPAVGFFVTTGEVTFHPAPAAQPALDMIAVRFNDLMTLAQQIIAEQMDDCDEEFMAGRAHGVGSFHSEILELSKRTALARVQDEAKAAGGAQTCRCSEKAQEILSDPPPAPSPIDHMSAALTKVIALDTLSAMLWLYRRLPRGYGRQTHIEVVIERLARQTDTDVAGCLAERGPDPRTKNENEGMEGGNAN
jgi:Lar family restriction alleviation protein